MLSSNRHRPPYNLLSRLPLCPRVLAVLSFPFLWCRRQPHQSSGDGAQVMRRSGRGGLGGGLLWSLGEEPSGQGHSLSTDMWWSQHCWGGAGVPGSTGQSPPVL